MHRAVGQQNHGIQNRLRPTTANPSELRKRSSIDKRVPVTTDQLQTYDEALAQYHLSPETKFDNARHLDSGRTERRHVIATGLVLIGKEANQVGESGEEDPISGTVAEFRGDT